jgi:hypothetical protein
LTIENAEIVTALEKLEAAARKARNKAVLKFA